jgi:AraC-like DNA-binding protein
MMPDVDALWAVGYREWRPPASLQGALACFWVSVIPTDAGPAVTNVLPDGCVDLIWQRGRGAFVAGPDTGPAPVVDPPGTVYAGVRFRPGAGGPALGVSLAELRDRRVDVAQLLPALSRDLAADLTPDRALRELMRRAACLVLASPPDTLVVQATERLSAGCCTVVGLSRDLAVSERQLRRRFDESVGYGPKTMHRVLRFRKVLGRLAAASRPLDLASLAIETGYADQAHLTRETSRLAGATPSALARALSPVT